ncbi:DUF3052 family protein [Trueperella sp. LYQ143]|uniref:DUF3052 family protein n=1 Tax=unclassified Trueperella TaxID=2630174 RepID=UPI00398368BA
MSGVSGKEFGFQSGQIVQEFGYDDDVDFDVREAIEHVLGEPLVDEDFDAAIDGVIAWWRADDGDTDDLTDYLVDCSSGLADENSVIWLFVPARHQAHAVPMEDVNEAADTAGLSVTSTRSLPSGWTAFRVVTHGRSY